MLYESCCHILWRRWLIHCYRSFTSRQLVYEEYGDPSKVLKLRNIDISDELKPKEVKISWKGSPINPADINQIQGVYPVKPDLPAVAGNEGFIGTEVTYLSPGDHVVALRSGLGSWQTHSVHHEDDLFKIDKNLPFEAAATIKVNPPTAYRMLKDFVDLRPDETIIQNGANSAVGKAVIQLAKAVNVHTINIVRNRQNLDELVDELKSLGADEVYTEKLIFCFLFYAQKVRLALNCIGGRSTSLLSQALSKGGVMVTYGGMSKQALMVSQFIDISLRGFWMTRWYIQQENKEVYIYYIMYLNHVSLTKK
ncbi:unnamed protein product [Dracunculus medinensis]|uniref:Enoyl-[acyl-carrier-protein] reductase, mitochondrial n=1 Tax=Dracunculus medinensis TaxID=318479 RepID=A0A0N4UFX7_DRAME|nr:unnamed protein product [Dracunculus medinensis]